jgi:hypothetical protein
VNHGKPDLAIRSSLGEQHLVIDDRFLDGAIRSVHGAGAVDQQDRTFTLAVCDPDAERHSDPPNLGRSESFGALLRLETDAVAFLQILPCHLQVADVQEVIGSGLIRPNESETAIGNQPADCACLHRLAIPSRDATRACVVHKATLSVFMPWSVWYSTGTLKNAGSGQRSCMPWSLASLHMQR